METENDFEFASDNGGLRKQLQEILAKNKELKEKVSSFEQVEKTRSVESFLKEKGVTHPKAQLWAAGEGVDVTDFAKFGEWLNENATAVGYEISTSTTEVTPTEAAAAQSDIEASQRLNSTARAASTPSVIGDFENRIAQAKTPQEVQTIMAEAFSTTAAS